MAIWCEIWWLKKCFECEDDVRSCAKWFCLLFSWNLSLKKRQLNWSPCASQYYHVTIRRGKCGIFVLCHKQGKGKGSFRHCGWVAVWAFLWISPWSCLWQNEVLESHCYLLWLHNAHRGQVKYIRPNVDFKKTLRIKCRGEKSNWFSKSRDTEATPLAESLHLNQSRVQGKREIH